MTANHVEYSAVLLGTPNRVIKVRGGSITLDESSAPHVTAQVDIAIPGSFAPGEVLEDPLAGGYGSGGYGEGGYGSALQTIEWAPDEDLLAALDTRLSPPPRIRLTATQTAQGQAPLSRTFDLTLRDREVKHANATVSLTLASDEALLSDYAPLTDDGTAYANQTSVRAIVNAVLAKVIPGATLATVPAVDADVSALANATNLSPNGGFRQNTNGWNTVGASSRQAGGPGRDGISYFARATFSAGQTGGWFNQGGEQDGATAVTVSPNRLYRTALWVRSSVAVSVALSIEWVNSAGSFLSASNGTVVSLPANTWTKLSTTAMSPVDAARAGAYVYRQGGSWGAGNTFDVAGHRFSEAPAAFDQFEFFDGETIDTTHYGYAWTGSVGASASTRVAITGRSFDMLRWKAGQSALEFLVPLVQVVGLRLVCDETRTWTLRPEGYTASDSLSIRHGVNLIDGTDRVSREDETWFDAAVTEHSWTDETGTQQTASDAFALSPTYSRLRTFQKSTPYPGPGFSAYVVRRAQGRGRVVSATCISDWRARAEQPISVVLQGAPIQTGQTSRVDFDLDRDEMTVSTRTTDTPATAWVLLPTGQRWIDSPVGGTWIGETP